MFYIHMPILMLVIFKERLFTTKEIFDLSKNEELDITKAKPILRTFLDLAKPIEFIEHGKNITFTPAFALVEPFFKDHKKLWGKELDQLKFEITEIKTTKELSKNAKKAIEINEQQKLNDKSDTAVINFEIDELIKQEKQFESISILEKNSYMTITLSNYKKNNNFSISGAGIIEINFNNVVNMINWLQSWHFVTTGITDEEFVSFDEAKELGYNIKKIGE